MNFDVDDFHDCLLTAIRVEEDYLYISFRKEEVINEFSIDGLIGIFAENFLKGNIVFSVELRSVPFNEKFINKNKLIIDKYCEYYGDISNIPSEGKILIITSSYGVDLIAVFSGNMVRINR